MDIMFSVCIVFFIAGCSSTLILGMVWFVNDDMYSGKGIIASMFLTALCLIGAAIFAPRDKKVECEHKYVVEHTIKAPAERYMDIDTVITSKPDTLYRVTFKEND